MPNDKKIKNLKKSNERSHRLIVDCLREALYSLLKTKDISEITVSELTKTAGVSRGGFYKNFYLVTDVLAGRQMEMPRPLKIVLRGFDIGGADWPVYSLTDHFFALCDGTDGEVSMFEEFYRNTFDGDTFDSDYIRIEGIADGRLNVTVKEGQPVWPEWTDENRAEDIAGSEYVLVGGKWIPAEEVPESEEDKAA